MNVLIYILLGIIGLIVILGLVAPNSYDVSRKIVIKKPIGEVYNYVKLVRNQEHWGPWEERDPDMKKHFTGTDGEVGFVSAWDGNKEVGSGEQEITGLDENAEVRTQLRFLKPFKSTSDAFIRTMEVEDGTEVTWGFAGSNKFPVSIFMIFMNMDKTIGKDFEYGLNKLKGILEQDS